MSHTTCVATCLNGRQCSHRAQTGRDYCGKHINAEERAGATREAARAAVVRATTMEVAERVARRELQERREAEARERESLAADRWAIGMAAMEETGRHQRGGETRRNRVALPLTSSEKSVKVECEECDDTCPICLEEIKGEKVVCSNGHAVCEKHIIESITANKGLGNSVLKCSVCRTKILTSQVSYACNALVDIVCNKSKGWYISDWNMIKRSVKNSEKSKA